MKLIVGNWKMNQNQAQVTDFFSLISVNTTTKSEAWIAPQAIHIPLALKYAGNIKIGAQNCSYEDSGAFTGENSPASLKDIGAHFTLVGHSERRQIFGENSEVLTKKTLKAQAAGLMVIHCVGETLEEREKGKTLEVIGHQLKEITGADFSKLVIAYEPVWAIGTGKVATPAQAQEVHAFIRGELKKMGYPQTKILYGGSVKPDNVQELMSQPDIDGALVGGASLKAQDFSKLCQ